MFTRLSLRLRIFLFFCLLALGGVAISGLALWIGWSRADPPVPGAPFLNAGVIASFLTLALVIGIWLLFDENVAKPIERLAAQMRGRAHAGVDAALDTQAARYLGDLAPAAQAVAERLSGNTLDIAAAIARETERLQAEKARLTTLLTEVPVAMILVNPLHQIVLYDGQAAEVLSAIAPPRLNAPLADYFESEALNAAHDRLARTGREVTFEALSTDGAQSYDARLKPLDQAEGYMMLIDAGHVELSPDAARPLVYDFDLLNAAPASADTRATRLRDLCFVAFDSETTGLLPHKDDVVQLGAVRVLNGRIVPGEQIDTYVDPGRPIPPASTKVHKVADAHVRGAPDIVAAGRRLHGFARDAVLVAHNAPFDLAFLKRHAGEMGVAWDHPVLDTVLLSAVVFGASETHTLDALCDRLGIEIPQAERHTALGDARATAEALVRMIPMLEGRGLSTFGEVIAETRKHGRLLADLN
ncbi:MAG: DNA polymerase III subunit epsilon [Rhodobacteraceae bacterium HLUCCA08]|nr:MAG: DNA polymerase III subunit epsilon [Rhodobacteraceae bacterium HLUCCA08]